MFFTGYITGHKLADLRDQGLVGAPTYKLTNIHGATVGFRRDSSLLRSETPDTTSNEDQQPSSGRNMAGPHRGKLRKSDERALRAHRPYPAAASVGPSSLFLQSSNGRKLMVYNSGIIEVQRRKHCAKASHLQVSSIGFGFRFSLLLSFDH